MAGISVWYRVCLCMGTFTLVYLCPVIHINQEKGPDFHGQTQITTIVQGDQIKKIFDNVTTVLLDKQEERFQKFISINKMSAKPTDCQDVESMGHTNSGVYTIYPKGTLGFPVYCDMENGAWTVIQRRIDGAENFDRDWNSYLTGFGNPAHEYWFGNQQIYTMTSNRWYELRIDMVNQSRQTKTVTYDVFYISNADSAFKLFVDGFHGDSDIKDNLRYHVGQNFSTFDHDQDTIRGNCALVRGGWWYDTCFKVNLNGHYGGGSAYGIHWYSWGGQDVSLTKTEMKIRRFQKK